MEQSTTGREDTPATVHRALTERYPMYKANPAFEGWLHERTGDDPAAIDAYLEMIDRVGLIDGEGTAAGDYTTLPMPDRLMSSIRERFERLPADTRTALSRGSVEGSRFSEAVVAAIGEIDPATVAGLLRPAVDAGLIAPDGDETFYEIPSTRYRFIPPGARDLVYGAISSEERNGYHASVVEYLSGELRCTDDPGRAEMLGSMVSAHNRSISRPDPDGAP